MENVWADLASLNLNQILASLGFTVVKLIALYLLYLLLKKTSHKVIGRLFLRYGERHEVSNSRVQTLKGLTQNATGYLLTFVYLVTVLQILGIQVGAIIAGAGIAGLAIGFGAQGLVSDVVTGFFLLLERQLEVGDYVTTGGFDGMVEQVGLKTTQIRSWNGTLHYVPNREITTLSNHSRGSMRAMIEVRIAYAEDIDKATQVIETACAKLAQEDKAIVEGPRVLGVSDLGPSEVKLLVWARAENMNQWAVERRLRKTLKEALQANGIEIPYPHQVYLKKEGPPS